MLSVSSPNPLLAALDAASDAPPAGRPSLLGATMAELEAFAVHSGEPGFRGRQVFSWLFGRRAQSFADMTDLPKRWRTALEATFDISRPHIDTVQVARDGTRKYRFTSPDHTAYEAVYIPEVAQSGKT